MAYEKKDFIWTPTEADGFNYTSNLATMASSIETAIGKYIYFSEGTATPQNTSNFGPQTPGNVIKVTRFGRMVSLQGRWRCNTADYITGNTGQLFAKIPAGYRPKNADNFFICVGSGKSRWVLGVKTNGDLTAERADTPQNNSYALIFNVIYLAED